MKYNAVTGIILVGGKSTRMGTNKAFLTLNDKTIIHIIVDLMKSIFSNVILITNNLNEYHFTNLSKYEDIFRHRGPLAGIHAGLTHSATEKNFVISCDMPLMEKNMIEYVIEFETEKPITVCRADGSIQQLAGLYSKSVLPIITNILNKKGNKSAVLSLLDVVPVEIINAEELDIYKKSIFFNLNRPEDYEKIKRLFN